MKPKEFNLVIVGVGGQGQITLLRILSESALISGYDFKASELHGLSQRGGSVEVQLRFGKNVFSPLVFQAGADFILALEMHEALSALYYASENTQFLINDFLSPIPGQESLSKPEILKEIKKFTKKIQLVEANQICKEKLGKEVLAGIFLISYASFKNLIPLKPNSILKAIKKIIPEKYLELNLKAFELAKSF
jgi:indolepyruvate ferredoxin oxidoreductase beta subunit